MRSGRIPRFRPYAERLGREPASYRLVRRAIAVVVAAHVPLALFSGYRALVQVYDLDVARPARPLRAGARVEAGVVTSGRARVTVRLELRQGAKTRLLGAREVRANGDPAYDPRPRRDTLTVTLTPAMLRSFAAGPAELRAVAVGRAQWLRVPPPTVAAVPVALRPE